MSKQTESAREKLLKVEQEMNNLFVERNEVIRGVIVATLSQTNVLMLGPAGAAKSALIKEWNNRITDSKYFERLLTKFTAPEELFGPPSFQEFERGRFVRVTEGMLPEANTAFLDEIFKSNSSILNSLLTILNERIFYNGPTPSKLELFTIAGASNEVPDSDDGLDAFMDRFLLKYNVEYVYEEGNFIKMLQTSLGAKPECTVTKKELQDAMIGCSQVSLEKEMLDIYVKLRKILKNDAFSVSDRTYKVALRLLQAEAWMRGRDKIDMVDFEIFKHIVWTHPDQKKKAQSTILELIAPEKNKIYELLDNCKQVLQKVQQKPQKKERTEEAMEGLHKVKGAAKEIAKYKASMSKRGADISDVERIEKEVESIRRTLLFEEIGAVEDLLK